MSVTIYDQERHGGGRRTQFELTQDASRHIDVSSGIYTTKNT